MSNTKSVQPTNGFTVRASHRLITGLFVAAASLVAVTGAQAQSGASSANSNASMYATGNSYMGLNAGQSDFSRVNNGTGIFGTETRTTAYNIYAGSYFNNKNLGFEIGYTDFGRVNRAGGSTKADGINLSLIGRLPINGSLNLLGKVGATYGRTDVSSAAGSGITAGSEIGFDVSYGVGAEYAFNQLWSGVFQYDEHYLKFAGNTHDRVSATTLGARYHF